MRKNIIVGLLCLVIFLAAYVGGIIVTVPQTISYVADRETKSVWTSCDQSGSQEPFVSFCGDEGGPAKPFTQTGNQTGP